MVAKRNLAPVAVITKEILDVDTMTVLADKGYHTGEQLKECSLNNITTYVPPKKPSTKDTGLYPVSSFTDDKKNDSYICPGGRVMRTNGRWHNHSDRMSREKSAYRFRRYTTPDCRDCINRSLCTGSKTNGRYIDRSEYADIIKLMPKG